MFFHTRFRNVLVALALCTSLLVVHATQVMHRPDAYKNTPHKFKQAQSVPQILHKRSGAKVNIGYFTNWGIYGANFRESVLYYIFYRILIFL